LYRRLIAGSVLAPGGLTRRRHLDAVAV